MKRTKNKPNQSTKKFAAIALALVASASFGTVLSGCGGSITTAIETNKGTELLPELTFANADEVYGGISKKDAVKKAVAANKGYRIVSDGGRYCYMGKNCWLFELQKENDASDLRKYYVASDLSAIEEI